jgi:hypothetical protein
MTVTLRLFCALALTGLLSFPAYAVSSRSLGAPDPQVCSAQPPVGAAVDADSPGRWNNPARPGTGWEFSYAQDKSTVEAFWYTYREDGQPEWLSTGPIQWIVEGWPVGVFTWSAPLFRHGYVDGQPGTPEAIGAVAFRRLPDDPTRLAVRWQLDGQAQFEEECLVDRSEVGFGGATLDAGLARGWSDPASQQYRVQWVVEPSRNGNRAHWLERPDLLAFSADGAPIWLTANAHVPIAGHASTRQNYQYRYYTGAYAGGRPTQTAAAQCVQAPQGCARSRGNAGRLTRTAVRDGSVDWSLDLRRIPDVPQSPDLVRENVQAEPTPEGPQVRIDRVWCSLLPEHSTCLVPVELLAGDEGVEVVRVDLNTGTGTPVTLGAEGLVLDELPVGRYRYELRSIAQRSKAKTGEEEAGAAASLEIEVSESEDPPPETAAMFCGSVYPVGSNPDSCEVDDEDEDYRYLPGGYWFRHNLHTTSDRDWKYFQVLQNYAATLRLEVQSPGQALWRYEIFSTVTGESYIGTFGSSWYQHVGIPTAAAFRPYYLKISPVDPSNPPLDSRYTAYLMGTYDPLGIAPDTFESDGNWSSAKTIADDDLQLRNFHVAGDRDWIKLTVSSGDEATISFQPEQPAQGSPDPWIFTIHRQYQPNTAPVEITSLAGSLRDVPVTRVINHSGSASSEIYFIEMRATNTQFRGAGSVYKTSLTVVTTIQPDTFDQQGAGDNTLETATPLSPGLQQLHNFHTSTDHDWMSHTPAETGTTVHFNIAPQDQNSIAPKFASQLWTLNEANNPVQIGEAQGGDATFGHPGVTLSQVSTRVNQPYWLEMYSTDGSLIGDPSAYAVTLTITDPPPPTGDEHEPDNNAVDATEMFNTNSHNHDFHVALDPDWVKVELQPGQTASFQLQGTASALNWRVSTYTNPSGSPTATINFGSTPITASVAHPGGSGVDWVYARIFPANEAFHGAGTEYTVSLSTSYPPDAYEPDNNEADAQLIPVNQNQLHSFHHVGDQDWYKISVGPNQTATFTLTPTTTNGSSPWSWQSYRDTGSGATALTSGSFGSAAGVVSVAHSGGAGSQSALLRVFRNPAVSGFQGDPSRYTARAALSGDLQPPSCSLSDWSSQSGTPLAGSSAHNPPVKTYFGTCGVQMSALGSYLVDQQPTAESTYNARFYYYTGNRSGISTIFQALTGGGTTSIQVQHDGNALIFNASGVTQNVVLADERWYEVSLQWRAGSGTGSLGIKVTGNDSDTPLPVSAITGLNNGSHRIESVRLGLISGTGTGSAVGFDEFQARRINIPKRHCRGDAVPDGVRDQLDIDAINAQIANQALALGQADVNEDGVVNEADITAIQPFINTTCP